MSNDLISKSVLLKDFRNTITEQSDTFEWLNMIARQPVICDGEWSITASDNTGFKLDCKCGIITLSDRYGNGMCEFIASDIRDDLGNKIRN